MPKIVMQIAKLDAPSVDAAGRKFGAKAYDSAGTKYTVPKAMFGMLQTGGWYEIFFEEKSYQGNKYNEIQSANATAPLTQPAGNGSTPVVKARTAKEDEEQINQRHRLAWIGERLDATVNQCPLDFAAMMALAEKWAAVYDGLRFKEGAEEAPVKQEFVSGQKRDAEMEDEIPF